jgi:hypothetical protein
VEPLLSDGTIIIDLVMKANDKLDEILAILRDDEEEAEDEADA